MSPRLGTRRSGAGGGADTVSRPNLDARQHVLVVDDDVSLLSLIERALAVYRVSTARDAGEALLLLRREDAIDLLITDYLMPGMTGEALVHEARKHRPTLPVLLVTGHGHSIAAAEAAWWQAEPHLTKPFRMETLLRAVEALVGPPHV